MGAGLWHTGGMETNFLEHVRQIIRESRSLSVEGLGARLGKSESQTYRILRGEGPYQVRYTAIIREYVGLGDPVDRDGTPTVTIDLVELRIAESLGRESDVLCRTTLPRCLLPAAVDPTEVKLIRVMDDHCAPAFAEGEHAFVNTAATLPEPSGIFLIWTGIGFKVQHVEYVIGTEPPEVRLSSTNPRATNSAIQLPLQQVTILGKLIGKITFNPQ